ncbi:MAG: golvesin C-terminal-like domain-containing protein, partial [Planctomycetota bacterium]
WLIDKGARYYRRTNWVSDPEVPTVQTNSATSILFASAKLNGTIVTSGSSHVDQQGFDWGRTSACSDGWLEGNVSGDNFSAMLIGLQGSTTYYFKARAHNSVGWDSGSVVSFKTDPMPANPEYIIDTGQTGTSYTGTWKVSGGDDPYGENSLYGRDGATYTWSYNYLPAGVYTVSAWWTAMSSRTEQAPYTIYHDGGSSQVVADQTVNGGQWNTLGQFYFDGDASVKLVGNDVYPISFCADAIKFSLTQTNQTPIAVIDSISPQASAEGQSVSFSGHGTDDDGRIDSYLWTSSLDGTLSSSASFSTTNLSQYGNQQHQRTGSGQPKPGDY